jgi:TadE-like protein
VVRRQRGQGLVEFALVAPIMLILLLILLDFGRAVFYSSQMSEAAREGARQATLQYNQGSNGGSSKPGVPGVVPIVRQLAGFGFGIQPAPAPTYTPPGSCPSPQPGSVSSSGTTVNTVYVYVYELHSDCSGTFNLPRTGSHTLVVVDLKMNFQPVVVALIGLGRGGYITLDAQSVQREEW